MPKFFQPIINIEHPSITGEDARHIARSLRMHAGDTLTLSDTRGMEYLCEIIELGDDCVNLRCLSCHKNDTEPNVRLTLFQCLPKGDKLDGIIKRSVELGVHTIVPVLSERCIARPDLKSFEKKQARYQKIAREAAMQSGRGIIPDVEPLLPFSGLCERTAAFDTTLLFYEGEARPVGSLLSGRESDIALIVGPEGGISQPEVLALQKAGVQTATLGKRILRCETAPLAALTVLLYLTGNM